MKRSLRSILKGNRQHWNRSLPVNAASRGTVSAKTLWTDYPFSELGDQPGEFALIRPVSILSYDGNKYVTLMVNGHVLECKYCYLYRKPGRFGDGYTKHIPMHWLKAME